MNTFKQKDISDKNFSKHNMASFNSLFVRLQPLVRVPFRTHVGYMPFEGPVVPKDSSAEILKKELKIVNLKPVTRSFDNNMSWNKFYFI